jgi:eukaryotic-like serine/threonine-protein kinase
MKRDYFFQDQVPVADLQQLGKYSIVEVLGKGAMGVVYKGFDPLIERHVALKTIRKELIDDEVAEQMVRRFKNEAQAAGRLTHPGIVGIYEYGEDGDTAFIAMEFVQGRGLRELLSKNERFSLLDAIGIMGQLLDALDHAHEQGIVHRDVKPANIIMMANGKLKVADFGIARINDSNLTTVGSVMGTPSYMSPEQFAGTQVDRRADLFACGIVFYELLTGSKPFEGATETIAYKICHTQHIDPSVASPGRVPAIFDHVIARALAKKPEQRFQTAREFADAVLKAYEKRGEGMDKTMLNPSSASPVGASGAPGKIDTTFPPAGWKIEELKPLEELLAPYLGPMARIVVKKAASQTTDPQKLAMLLADNVGDEEERRKFLAAALARTPGGTNPGSVDTQTTTRFGTSLIDPEDIAKAAELLAPYVGPIAKVLAKKAAAGKSSRTAMYLVLAENISDPADKAKFLKDVGIKKP